MEAGLEWGPDGVIVSVPGAYHIPVCLTVARAAKHIFCEVPLATSLDGTDELAHLAHQHSLVIAPGCQPLFHPVIRKACDWIRDPEFGTPLAVTYATGSYLPDWHPYEDYRAFYASNAKMGGGNLDVIAQEVNVLRAMIGQTPDEIFCRAGRLSSLDIHGTDCQQVLARTSSGISMSLHFDLIQRAGYSGYRIISEQGTVAVENLQAKRYLAKTKTWKTYGTPEGFEYEQCYIQEIGCFIKCMQETARWPLSLEDSVRTVQFLLAMQRSAAEQRTVYLAEFAVATG